MDMGAAIIGLGTMSVRDTMVVDIMAGVTMDRAATMLRHTTARAYMGPGVSMVITEFKPATSHTAPPTWRGILLEAGCHPVGSLPFIWAESARLASIQVADALAGRAPTASP